MIHIDMRGQTPAGDWLERARQATEQMEDAGTDAERHAIIDRNDALWGELKAWLLGLSQGKCWFSEARDIYSHFDVEHFRPKKSAKSSEGMIRGGYWWLAFDYLNYRICGNVGNRKKGTFFPLASHSAVGTADNRALVEDELCLLLDPANEDDPLLLSFNETGDAEGLADCGEWEENRVTESIRRFKLNEHQPLVEARRDLWRRCRDRIAECQNLMAQQATVARRERIRAKMSELRALIRPDAVLSATARECLRKSNIDWAKRIAASN